MKKHKARKTFYIIVPILATILTVLCIEFALSLLHPIPHSIEKNMYFESDPFTGFRLKPNGTGYYPGGIKADANLHGHRDDEVTLHKQSDGVFRLIFLGDSFTVGSGVAQEKAYPQVLEKLLQQNLFNPIEIVNAACGGWQPLQYVQYYEHYGREFHPDAIFVGFFVGNDTYDPRTKVEQFGTAIKGRRVSREAATQLVTWFKVFLHETSHLARFAMTRYTREIDFTREDCQDFAAFYLAIQGKRMRNHYRRTERQDHLAQPSMEHMLRLKAMADRQGIPLVVVLLPDENQINAHLQDVVLAEEDLEQYDFNMPQSMLAEMLGENDISVIDLLPYFREDNRCLYMNHTHWTPEGHALAAKIIHQKIMAGRLLPGLTCGSPLSRRP